MLHMSGHRRVYTAWILASTLVGCARAPQAPTHDAGVHITAASAAGTGATERGGLLLQNGRSISDVAQAVTPSVVNVFSERSVRADRRLGPFFSDPFFRFFFDAPESGPQPPESRREQSLGSGVIVSSDGLVVTNSHVVDDAEQIRVALKDGREFKAKVVGADRESDVALLRVPDANDLPAITLADSSKLRIGDLVLAVGNPFGLGQTVTMGIVSAVGRANMGITDYEDFIQTDAAINPGNSGGALVDMDGHLVGINTAILSRSGGYQGIGFAIPSNMVLQVKDALLKGGKVIRGWLGVSIQDLNEELAKALEVAPHSGVLVSDVAKNSPAAKAGIVRGDIIRALDGVKLEDSRHLRNTVALSGPGRKLRVELIHDGKAKTLEVVLGEAPASNDKGVIATEDTGLFAGVRVAELSAALREKYEIPEEVAGIVVTDIERDSAGAELGLRPGDVILQINRREVRTLDEFRKAARDSVHQALVLVYRDGTALFLSLTR
jgi:serine protease Do